MRAFVLLLALSLLPIAGCLDAPGALDAPASTPDAPASLPAPSVDAAPAAGAPEPPAASAAPASESSSAPVVRNVTVRADFTAPGLHGRDGGADLPSCAPTSVSGCRAGVHERIDLLDRSVLDVDILDTAWVSDWAPDGEPTGIMEIEGAIAGCAGAGTMTLDWRGALGDPPLGANANGDVVHEHDFASDPRDVSGFAGILDVWLDFDAYVTPVGAGGHGIVTGYVLCLGPAA